MAEKPEKKELQDPGPDDLGETIAAYREMKASGKEINYKTEQRIRRNTAIRLKLMGLTDEQIGEQLGIAPESAASLIQRTLSSAEARNIDQMREVENLRLDRLHAAVWAKAIAGDYKAIDTVLRISSHRVKINGLAAPERVEVNMTTRNEMVQALDALENLVLKGEVVESERVVPTDEDRTPTAATPALGSTVSGEIIEGSILESEEDYQMEPEGQEDWRQW